MSRHGHGQSSSAVATLLVLAGVATVLTVTFGAGFVVGRFWPDIRGRTGGERGAAVAQTDASSASSTTDRSARHDGRAGTPRITEVPPSDSIPTLTFYRELTAPLTSWARSTDTAKPEPRKAAPRPVPTASSSADGKQGYTVQVAAYRSSAQAYALRDRLGAHGFVAEVSDVQTAAGPRYRVRIGSYATRAAAVEAAAHIASEAHVETVVAAR